LVEEFLDLAAAGMIEPLGQLVNLVADLTRGTVGLRNISPSLLAFRCSSSSRGLVGARTVDVGFISSSRSTRTRRWRDL